LKIDHEEGSWYTFECLISLFGSRIILANIRESVWDLRSSLFRNQEIFKVLNMESSLIWIKWILSNIWITLFLMIPMLSFILNFSNSSFYLTKNYERVTFHARILNQKITKDLFFPECFFLILFNLWIIFNFIFSFLIFEMFVPIKGRLMVFNVVITFVIVKK
jgi:hypothetical protein